MCGPTAGSPPATGGVEFYDACWCAGTGCGGHAVIRKVDINWTPIGWQGPVQHTWTHACDGLHGPGPCPERLFPVTAAG